MKFKEFNLNGKKKRNTLIGGSLLVLTIGSLGIYNHINSKNDISIPEVNKVEKKTQELEEIEDNDNVDVSSINTNDAGKIDNSKDNIKNKDNIKEDKKELSDIGQNNNTVKNNINKNGTTKEDVQKQTKPKETPKVKPEYPNKDIDYEPGTMPGFDVNTDEVNENGNIGDILDAGGDWDKPVGQMR